MPKKMLIVFVLLAGTMPAAHAAGVSPSFSANLGFNSQYIFRGIPQKTASAFGGLDLKAGGFYLGTWAADVGDGLEMDYYGGYRYTKGDFSGGLGGTWYTYTGDFDDEYREFNASGSWKWISLDVAIGSYANFGGPRLDYQFYAVTVEHLGFYGRIGTFDDDFSGTYYEAGYGNTLTVGDTDILDYAIAVVHSDATLLSGESDTNLVFTLSKAFDF